MRVCGLQTDLEPRSRVLTLTCSPFAHEPASRFLNPKLASGRRAAQGAASAGGALSAQNLR